MVFSKQNPLQLSQQLSRTFSKQLDETVDVIVMDKTKLSREQKAFVNTLKMLQLQ